MKAGDANKLVILETLRTLFGTEMVETEFRFHPVRRWRFDYAIPEIKLAIEYNGHAAFAGRGQISGHSSITGITRDAEKLNAAIGSGWRVLQFTALHFRPADRYKHNLTDVRSSVMNALAAIAESHPLNDPALATAPRRPE